MIMIVIRGLMLHILYCFGIQKDKVLISFMLKCLKRLFLATQISGVVFYYIQSNEIKEILIEHNAYFKKAVFHSPENIKSCISQPWTYKLYFQWNWMSSVFSIDFLEPTSKCQTPVTFLSQNVGIYFLS